MISLGYYPPRGGPLDVLAWDKPVSEFRRSILQHRLRSIVKELTGHEGTEVILLRGGGTYTFRERGKIKYQGRWHNAATTEGRNLMLNDTFRGTAADSTWFAGLVDNSGFSAFAAGDTMASHSGWTEATGYAGNRKAWSPGAAASSLLSAAATQFVLNATATIYGAFLCGGATGTADTLWATGAFDTPRAVVNTDTLDLTYECEMVAVA